MHGITCHAAAASMSAAVELSVVSCAECCHLVGSCREMHGITRQIMHGIICHAEAALSSAAVELSAVAVAERMLPPRSRAAVEWCNHGITRRVMHGITCHAMLKPHCRVQPLS